jgi:iron complex outermembrane receptor protein
MTNSRTTTRRRRLLNVEASVAALIVGMNVAVAEERPSAKPKPEEPAQGALSVPAEDAATSSGVVQDVVVTAQRREQDIQEVPIAITAVPGQRIQSLHFRDAADISLLVPNFNAQPSGRLTPRWFLRGVGIADPRAISPLGIHYDDVYLQNTTFTNFPLFDLERVEVLRGPQGTLWGKNTTAGAINFISKKPSFEPQDNFIQADFGNYSSKLFNGGVGGVIIPDRVAARFAFHVDSSDGYTFNQIDGSRVGDITVGALRGQVLVKVTDDLDALFNAHYNRFYAPHETSATHFISTRADGTNGFGYRFPPPSLYNYYASLGNSFTDLRTYGGFINLTQRFGDYTLVSISALDHLDNSTQGGTGIPQLATQTRGFVSDQQISQEFRLLSPSDAPLTWLAGAHLFFDDLSTVAFNATLPGGPQFSNYQNITNRTTTSEYAGFAHAGYQLDPVFRIEAGIRLTYEARSNQLLALTGGTRANPAQFRDRWRFWLPASVSSPLTVSAYQNASPAWPAVTYDITPEIAISDNVRGYFRYAKGFRSGAFNVSATSQSQVAVVNPEVLYDYEGGIKSEWFENRLILNMAAFYYNYQNIQINVLQPTGPGGSAQSTISNGGTGFSKGLELETRALPTDTVEFLGNLGLLWTGFTSTPPGSGISVGNDFARAPHVSLGWGGRYTFPLAEYSLPGAIVLSTDWKFTTKFYYGVSDAAHNPTQIQSPTLIGNGQLVYQYENYELGLWARNITNRRFPQVMLPTAYGASGSEEAPRAFGGTLRVTF